jgi:trehalose synthase
MLKKPKIYKIEDYAPLVGENVVDRIRSKAELLHFAHVVHVNSTYYGGGVAEILLSLTLLMNEAGIRTGWRNIHGYPDFFNVTKKMHNALQGGDIDWNARKIEVYEANNYANSLRTHLDSHDFVLIHDPQPLPMIECYRRKGPWIWRCHIDLTRPHPKLWKYLVQYVKQYDAMIVSIPKYRQKVDVPQHCFMPAIDPFSIKNRELTEAEMKERLEHYKIPTDLPIVTQISRFDRWKDPEGVIEAFKIAQKKVDCTLVLLGNAATDDPEGQEVYESLLSNQGERILILACGDDTALVNTLQKKSAVVLQKSTREGFGLTVTEAMWKGTPVIGGKVGGIPHQITDGENGFLVASPEEAAERIVTLVKDKDLRRIMGGKARESVKKKFLMTRLLEQYLDLFHDLSKKRNPKA